MSVTAPTARPERGPDAGAGRIAGIILAGSYHWNPRSLDEIAPRPLMPVAQIPLVRHVIGWLRGAGITRAALCANGVSAAICRAIAADARLDSRVVPCEDSEPRGTAGCSRDACAHLVWADTVVVADGSVVPTIHLAGLLDQHRATGADVTVVVDRGVQSPGHPALRPVGIYVFRREALDGAPARGFCDIKENLVPMLHAEGARVVPFVSAECCPRVFDAASYLAVNHWLIPRAARQPSPLEAEGYRVSGTTAVHPTAIVDPGATMLGPVLLGPDVIVETGATIIGPTSLGPETIVESGALVARSVSWRRCLVAHGAFVDRSVLTDDVVAAAGERVIGAIRVAPRRARPTELVPVGIPFPPFANPVLTPTATRS